jgi:hypothetical protein
MSPDKIVDPDRDLARLFEEQRREDASLAPAFSELLARPRRRRESAAARMTWRPALVRTVGTVLMVVLVAAAALLLRRPDERERPTPDSELLATASALADWKAPSDSLLETPGTDLLRQVPVFASPESPATTLAAPTLVAPER